MKLIAEIVFSQGSGSGNFIDFAKGKNLIIHDYDGYRGKAYEHRYTIPSNGYIDVYIEDSGWKPRWTTLTINGVSLMNALGFTTGTYIRFIPVKKGDVIYASGRNQTLSVWYYYGRS